MYEGLAYGHVPPSSDNSSSTTRSVIFDSTRMLPSAITVIVMNGCGMNEFLYLLRDGRWGPLNMYTPPLYSISPDLFLSACAAYRIPTESCRAKP